jgi:hypothetical protein
VPAQPTPETVAALPESCGLAVPPEDLAPPAETLADQARPLRPLLEIDVAEVGPTRVRRALGRLIAIAQ